jgi:hypothetical protein
MMHLIELCSFAPWKNYDPVRAELMQSELRRILAAEKLSPDSFEVANRCLK